jgi:hypothetical protein
MVRDADTFIGITRVKTKQNVVKINVAKNRDAASNFAAYYQTNFDRGLIKFLQYSSGEF